MMALVEARAATTFRDAGPEDFAGLIWDEGMEAQIVLLGFSRPGYSFR